MILKRELIVSTFLLALAGCANHDAVLQKQVEIESRLERLVQGSAASEIMLAELAGDVKELKEKAKVTAADLDALKKTSLEVKPVVAEKPVPPPAPAEAPPEPTKIEVVNKDVQPKEKESGPPEAYVKAFGLYSANKYTPAIEGFEAFMAAQPGSEFAGNAQYWIGECHYTQNNLPKALEAFTKVIEGYPKSNKVPDAMLKAGYTLYAMKDVEKGKAMLEALIAKYPKSHLSVKAKERLNRR